jgi:hypothetical protein
VPVSTNFPSALDSFTNPAATDTMAAVPHHTQHANANDAIAALEAKVGVNNSGDSSSIDYRVRHLESLGSHTHVSADVPPEVVDGITAGFTLSQAPTPAASLMLFLNGVYQTQGVDYTLSGRTVTFLTPPDEGGAIIAHYIVS